MGQVLHHSLERNKKAFLKKASRLHCDKYDYSKADYVNTHTKIIIICPTHGAFLQTPARHLNSRGCNRCRLATISSKNVFLANATAIHGNKYDYSDIVYKNNDTPIKVICPKHGAFWVRPRSHTSSRTGCPSCWKKYDQSPMERAKRKFGGKFTYVNKKIVCPIHGVTGYNIHQHVKTKHGCRACYESSRRLTLTEYLQRVKKLHRDKYDYPGLAFSSMADEIKIVCKRHGMFRMTAGSHLYEQKGCWGCANGPLELSEFIKRAQQVHMAKYDYSRVKYRNIDTKVEIVCREHGPFWQRPAYHLNGNIGCAKCMASGLQILIRDHLAKQTTFEECNRDAIAPLEIDFYIPALSLGIEIHGNYFHSYNRVETTKERHRHKLKADLASINNITLLQFFEHEIKYKPQIVFSMINHKLGKSRRIGGRQCKLDKISAADASRFFLESHIDGHVPATVYYGLFNSNKLVSAISFTGRHRWQITRYATIPGLCVIGGFSKMLKNFITEYCPKSLMTFANRRFSDARVYLANGFTLVGVTKPNYVYLTASGDFAGNRQMFQKHKLSDKLEQFDPLLTEAENMFNHKYRRLWDAGHIKLRLV